MNHPYMVEFNTQVDHPDYQGMNSIWTKLGTAETVDECMAILGEQSKKYQEWLKGVHQEPNRKYRVSSVVGGKVYATFNTMTGESTAVLQNL